MREVLADSQLADEHLLAMGGNPAVGLDGRVGEALPALGAALEYRDAVDIYPHEGEEGQHPVARSPPVPRPLGEPRRPAVRYPHAPRQPIDVDEGRPIVSGRAFVARASLVRLVL